MPEFDYQAAIKELAEAEMMPVLGLAYPNNTVVNTETGHIVPFASLRVDLPGVWSHQGCKTFGCCDLVLFDAGMKLLQTADCGGRGWVPESDVEKACWEIAKVRADAVKNDSEARRLADNMAEDSLLLDTLAWVKEQHG